MAQPQQRGEMVVACNSCGKTKKVKPADYYKKGGMNGGCCTTQKEVNDGAKGKITINVPCTWGTVSPGTKLKTNKPSRDRKGRGSMKG